MAVQSKEADASNNLNGTLASPCESRHVTHNSPTGEQQAEVADMLDDSDQIEGKKPSK